VNTQITLSDFPSFMIKFVSFRLISCYLTS